jgi:hypothetical protein
MNPIESDAIPTFTELDGQDSRNRERGKEAYGAGFMIEESTEDMRIQARAVIFDDVPSPEITESESKSEDFSDKIVYEPGRKGLRGRIAKKLRDVKERLERKVEKVEHIVLRRHYGKVKRGVGSKFSHLVSHCLFYTLILERKEC